jgi:hypothetical protein
MADVTFTAISQPAPACYPPDVNALLVLIATLGLKGTIPDTSGGGVFVGSSPPSSSLTNKVWFKTDAAGRPFGAYMFYNGNWRKCYTGSLGDIKLYLGAFNGVFDGTGRGIIGGTGGYDEDGWAICNGNNGTPNLEGYFPCGARWSGSAWVTNPETTEVTSGGQRGPFQIAAANLPQLTVNPYGIRVGSTPGGGGAFLGSYPSDPHVGGYWPINETLNSPNNPLPIHLFVAMAYLLFIGYA